MAAAALVTCILALGSWSSSDDVTTEGVIQALRTRNEALKSLSMMMKMEVQVRSLLSGETFEYPVAIDLKLDRALGRFRCHLHGQTIMGPIPQKGNKEYLAVVDELAVFDGERTKKYTRLPAYEADGSDSGRFIETAHVFPGETAGWSNYTEEIIGAAALAKDLQEHSYTAAREGDLIVVECITRAPSESKPDSRTRVWFDVQKGMARQRERLEKKDKEDRDWVMYAESIVKEWSEVAPGLWLPAKYTDEAYYFPTGQGRQLLHRKVAEITYSDINRDFDSETFKLKFPPGITVRDNERGNSYKTAAITDATLDADARQALALRDAYRQTQAALEARQKSAWPAWAWPAIAAGAVLVLALAVMCFVKAATRPTPGGPPHA